MVGDALRDGIFLRKMSETIKRNTITTIKHIILIYQVQVQMEAQSLSSPA
jgi:hypothetical protein